MKKLFAALLIALTASSCFAMSKNQKVAILGGKPGWVFPGVGGVSGAVDAYFYNQTAYVTGQGQVPFTSLLSVSRASAETYGNCTGTQIPNNTLAIGPAGLQIWESRTNLFLNSAALSTQGITVAASPFTVSFCGTGSIAFSGAYTGSLSGTGATNLVSLTFTPSAGTLTATVTGTVTYANAEQAGTASPWILTTGTTASRAADNITAIGPLATALRATPGSVFMQTNGVNDNTGELVSFNGNGWQIAYQGSTMAHFGVYDGTNVVTVNDSTSLLLRDKASAKYNGSSAGVIANSSSAVSGSITRTNATGTPYIGSGVGGTQFLDGNLERLVVLPNTYNLLSTTGSNP